MRAIVLIFLFVSFNGSAEECLAIDSEQTNVVFRINQSGTLLKGNFGRTGGELCIANDIVTQLYAWLDPASVETGSPRANRALVGSAFFAVEEFPRATFESHDIEKTDDGLLAHGTLTVKGISKPFDLLFTPEKTADGYRVGGETRLRRLAFDIGTGQWSDTDWLSDEVIVEFLIVAN
ncbi:MAG TPA: YceI family protein [Gammaproteobacteria bacterium]